MIAQKKSIGVTNLQLVSKLFRIAAAWDEKARTHWNKCEREAALRHAKSHAEKAALMLANPNRYPLTEAVINVG